MSDGVRIQSDGVRIQSDGMLVLVHAETRERLEHRQIAWFQMRVGGHYKRV